jgi:nucleoid-associated protein EbfC
MSITIDPEIVKSGDREMLQDLVAAAVNEAIRRAQQMMSDEMSKLTGGLRIPGLG